MYFKDVIFTCKLRYPFEDDVALHFLNFESTLPKDILRNVSLKIRHCTVASLRSRIE